MHSTVIVYTQKIEKSWHISILCVIITSVYQNYQKVPSTKPLLTGLFDWAQNRPNVFGINLGFYLSIRFFWDWTEQLSFSKITAWKHFKPFRFVPVNNNDLMSSASVDNTITLAAPHFGSDLVCTLILNALYNY